MALLPRMFMGLDTGGNFAWRATLPGFNALTETDQENFAFNSDWLRSGIVHEAGTTDGSGYVMFDELPFVPHVLPFRLDDDVLFAGEQTVFDWTVDVAGPISGYWPIDIRVDRFIMNFRDDVAEPHVFPYIVFKVPIIGA
jgi:hypothetical protein